MKAVVYTGPRELRYQEVREPEPGADEVVVRVDAVGICGSEIHGVASQDRFRVPPLIMGHELCGVREDTGQRVVVNPLVACLECDRCRRGQENLCRSRAVLGIHRPGGFAERVAIPVRNLHPVPDGLSPQSAAMVEPLANAIHAWRLPADRNPQRVGIVGAGTIGLVTLVVAKTRGVPEVEVSDLAPERLAVAERLGADRVGPELAGEFDVVVDAVGKAATRRQSLDRLRSGGDAVWLGLDDDDPGFTARSLVRLEQSVHGSFCYTHDDFVAALRLVPDLDTSWVTTLPLADGVGVFKELMNGRADLLKVQLTP
jgi:threonine dehydrogenase-like Zn-dependent dehydrogenase